MKYELLLILSFISFYVFPQHDNSPLGGRSAAMANASVCLNDIWAAQNNQAGLAELNNIETGVYYENRFLLKELSDKTFVLGFPVNSGVFALDFNNFGFDLYIENKLGFAFAKKLFDNFSAGVQLDYLYTHIAENYGNNGLFTYEIGIRTKINKKLILAAHIFNPINSKLSDYNNERIPSILKFGVLYNPVEKLNICAESEKDINYQMLFRFGFEYNITKSVFVRTGISTNPTINSFGFGFEFKNLKLDFSSSIQQVLGYSPQFSLSYIFD